MSGAAAQQPPTETPAVDPAAAEALARRWGWKPKEEFRGDPAKWIDADQFVQRGFETPAVLVNRMQDMDRKMTGLEQRFVQQNAELVAARQSIGDMSEMVRRGDERGYKRARAELIAQRDAAIEVGDKATVRVADQALEELDATKPPPKTTATDPQKPTAPQPTQPQPEVLEFYRENPWYTTDPEMRAEADALHVGLVQTRPNITLAENLKLVSDRMRRMFPDKFARPKANGSAEPEPEPEPARGNPRREEPAAVAASGESGGRQPRGTRRTFDAMPAESKAAFTRYAKMVEGKGKPLTKEEWAADYWAQFEEV